MVCEGFYKLAICGGWIFAKDVEGGLLEHGGCDGCGEPFAGGLGGFGLVDGC